MANETTYVRRTDKSIPQMGDYFTSPERYYNQIDEQLVVNIRSGQYHVFNEPGELLVTVLGSCIATCVFDPIARVGGMNHFLVPGDPFLEPSPKYGVYAMEYMINDILKLGGIRQRLIVKVFGGARITEKLSMDIGRKNIDFIHDYLANESMPIAAENVGDDCARRVHFRSDDGKVMLRRLQRQDDFERVATEEEKFNDTVKYSHDTNAVEFFK